MVRIPADYDNKLFEVLCTRYVLNPFVTSGYDRLYERDSGCSEGHSGSGLKCDLESLINSPSLKTRRDPLSARFLLMHSRVAGNTISEGLKISEGCWHHHSLTVDRLRLLIYQIAF